MNCDKPLRWGVLGTGWVAQRFLDDLRSLGHSEAIAVASRSESRAREVGARFGVMRAYGSCGALVQDPEVDVVYVATEHHLHAEHCESALRAGKHVLCEKPFTVSVQEAERVIEQARERSLFCMEAMWSRFLPAAAAAKRRIDAGEIGDPRLLTADFGFPVVGSASSRFYNPAKGGGALLDRGVYAISLAVWLFGKPTEVNATADVGESGVDETVAATLRFPGGRVAVIAASLQAYSSNEAVVAGSAGRIRFSEPFCRPVSFTLKKAVPMDADALSAVQPSTARERAKQLLSRVKRYVPSGISRFAAMRFPVAGYGYGYEAAEVVRCIREGLNESPVMPLGETLTVMDTIERIRRQLQ